MLIGLLFLFLFIHQSLISEHEEVAFFILLMESNFVVKNDAKAMLIKSKMQTNVLLLQSNIAHHYICTQFIERHEQKEK